MVIKHEATVEDLAAVPENGKAEIVDMLSLDVIRAYDARDPDHPRVFRRGDIADAEPAVPRWQMAVDELWP